MAYYLLSEFLKGNINVCDLDLSWKLITGWSARLLSYIALFYSPVNSTAASDCQLSVAENTKCMTNTERLNLAKGGIAAESPPNSSFVFARWQLQFTIACFGWGSTPNFPFPCGVNDPHLTQCVVGPYKCTCQMASKSVKQGARMCQRDRRQTDRPRYGEVCRNRRNRLHCKK